MLTRVSIPVRRSISWAMHWLIPPSRGRPYSSRLCSGIRIAPSTGWEPSATPTIEKVRPIRPGA